MTLVVKAPASTADPGTHLFTLALVVIFMMAWLRQLHLQITKQSLKVFIVKGQDYASVFK